MKELTEFTLENEEAILDDLRGLIKIDSTSGDAGEVTEEAPLGENISRAIDYVLDLAEKEGFRTKHLDGYSGWAEIGPEEADEMIGILAHVDTVPVGDGWNYEPFDLTVEGDKLYGRGTNDDKGPIIAALYAMKKLIKEDKSLNRRIRLILGGDEESGGWLGLKRYKETEETPTYAFTPDSEYPVIFAEKGILQLNLKSDVGDDEIILEGGSASNMVPDHATASVGDKVFEESGVAVHAKNPALGENALIKLSETLIDEGYDHPLLNLLEITSPEGLDIAIEDEPSGKLTINPAIAKLDKDGSSLICDVRYPVTADRDEILEKIKEKTEPLGFQTEVNSVLEPLYVPKDSELVEKLLKVYNDYTGDEAEPLSIGGGTYARAFDNTVAFGVLFPGEKGMAHQVDEYWSKESLLRNVDLISEALSALT